MTTPSPFTWRHCQPEIILCEVRWYLLYSLSYLMSKSAWWKRGLWVDHTPEIRWGQCYAPELDTCCRPPFTTINDSHRVHETYIKIKKMLHSFSRAVNSDSDTCDLMLSETRDKAAQHFFRKTPGAPHTVMPCVITADKNATRRRRCRWAVN
jgi:transposase-like protein